MKSPAPHGRQHDETSDSDNPEHREVEPVRAWWMEVGMDVLKASLVAALGILVREATDRITGPRRRSYDSYDEL